MRYLKRVLGSVAITSAILTSGLLAGCGGVDHSTETAAAPTAGTATQTSVRAAVQSTPESLEKKDGTWAVYMYVCGSDLESDDGDATENFVDELMPAVTTDDAVIVAQTGGTAQWHNSFMNANKTQRWLYSAGEMKLVDEEEQADMGESDTLADFLTYASANYPADHTMVLIWDHGGGTLEGCCDDENYNDDSLSLTEMHDAFSKAYDLSENDQPVDILGFDCCLMGTIDVADTFSDTAHYLVASEEIEPGYGWNYAKIAEGLESNPTIDAHDLGVLICDSYMEKMEQNDSADTATLSLTDLTKVGDLKNAFTSFADEMLINAYHNTECFKEYAICAGDTENYGGNVRDEKYTDLIDMKHFVKNTGDSMKSAEDVLNALDASVVYKVSGKYRPESGGLSFYYDYDGWDEKNEKYIKYGTIEPLKALYTFGVSGKVAQAEGEYMEKLGLDPNTLPKLKTFDNCNFKDIQIRLNENRQAYAEFGSDAADLIADARFQIYYIREDGAVFYLGSDDDVTTNVETGTVSEYSEGQWGYFEGNLAIMELTYSCDDYNMYSVPVIINGRHYFLQVAYDKTAHSWEVLGARAKGTDTAKTSRALTLEDGTEITLVQKAIEDDGTITEVEGATFTYHGDSSFNYTTLIDGNYAFRFVIEDLFTNRAYSNAVKFEIENGKWSYYMPQE